MHEVLGISSLRANAERKYFQKTMLKHGLAVKKTPTLCVGTATAQGKSLMQQTLRPSCLSSYKIYTFDADVGREVML
jgi:hypothetical protein